MKRIRKCDSPAWFEAWKANFKAANGREATYKKDFPLDKKRQIRNEAVAEQGYICCYCMKRISVDSSHLEHFLPQQIFPLYDMDYSNMLASCEGNSIQEDHCGHRKNNWHFERMVSPVKSEIEEMFHYSMDGTVHASGNGEQRKSAKEMIENLGLNSFSLVRNRRAAIIESLLFDENDYEREELQDLIEFYDNMDNGKYIPYCRAIVDAINTVL